MLGLLTLGLSAARDPDIAYSESTVLTLSGEGRPRLRARVEIEQVYLSKRATDRTTFSVSEDYFAKIQNLSGRVRTSNLESNRISRLFPQRRDIFLSSEQIHQLEFPGDLKPGERISFGYDQQFLDIAFTPMFQVPNLDEVRRFEVAVDHPADILVEFDFYYPAARLNPTILRPSSTRTLIRFEHLTYQPSLRYLAHQGAQAFVLPRFLRGGVLLNPATPDRFSEWYLKLLEEAAPSTPTMPSTLQEALAKATGDRSKMRILFDFVKESIRYAADETAANAIIPRDPAFVLKNGFGDCKDKAQLLRQLAHQLGLKVDLVLVFSDHAPEAFGLSVGTFNHMICRFQDKDGNIYLDPTARDVEFGNLPLSDVHHSALVLDPGNPHLVRLPYQRKAPSLQIEIVGSLEEPRRAIARVVVRNEFLALAHRARRELRALDLENKLSNSINQHLYKISLDHFTPTGESLDAMEFKAIANLDDFLVNSPTRTYLPKVPFKTHDADLLKRGEDTYPMDVAMRPWIQLRIDLENRGIQVKSESVRLGDASAETFEAVADRSDTGARFTYETHPTEEYFAGEAKRGYLDFFGKYLLQRRNLFAITRSQP